MASGVNLLHGGGYIRRLSAVPAGDAISAARRFASTSASAPRRFGSSTKKGEQLGRHASAAGDCSWRASAASTWSKSRPRPPPPVCRIIDFGKYLYEQKKRAHEAKKKQVVIEVKEIKFRPATDDHDYNFKMKHATGDSGATANKVKATVRFRGREITHKELGMQLLDRLECRTWPTAASSSSGRASKACR